MNNIIFLTMRLNKRAILNYKHVYYDLKDNPISERIFSKNKLKIKILSKYENKNREYAMFYCKFRKRDINKFLNCIDELSNTMSLLGHKDYEDFCKNIYYSYYNAYLINQEEKER